MGKKSSKPSGSKAAEKGFKEIGQISKAQLNKQYKAADERQNYDQEQWRKNKERLSGIDESLIDYSESALQRSEADRQRYEDLYQPIEEQYLEKVQGYDTPERRTTEAAAAQAEVASQAEAARTNALRRLESYGVDPSQTRNSALDAGLRVEEAKQKAAAATGARNRVEDRGMELEAGTVAPGRGLDTMSRVNAVSGAGAIPEFGMDAESLYGQGNQALDAWGGALGSNATMGAAQAKRENEAGSALGGAIGTGVGAYFGGPVGAGIGGSIGSGLADGGEVVGPGGPKDDAIDTSLSDGEFVIPAEVVTRKGTEFFDKLIEKVRTEQAEREANAQIGDEAMAIPPPEAVAPDMGMYKGGEVKYNQGGEAKALPAPGVQMPMVKMNYPPPPTMSRGY